MLNIRQKFGKFGENLAVRYLKKQGYQIICQNYRTKLGEIDIIAKEDNEIVFVEVKSRRTSTFGHPKHSITLKKQQQISKTALYYLKETNQSNVCARFDVVTVNSVNQKHDVEVIKNAFELAWK